MNRQPQTEEIIITKASDLRPGDKVRLFNYSIDSQGFTFKQAFEEIRTAMSEIESCGDISSHPDHSPYAPSLHVTTNTNLYLLEEDEIDWLQKHKVEGSFHVQRNKK